ncbi:helix-turn-helix transcriptional regulator [Alsobacter sp. SYSU M60028]|uniref:Helix-turn-helix transcriptional regulator n=1 Tax=Alsobacter ponti TaxID=2962936 RepID=A0ABT1LB83_9HYPH|nr:helix-turn-helix transcriptional regulator [Alsobacter ponti]MCP8938747.1 helix-turn-helix transcriptional regulator [Alsobacter ponti]
MSDCRQACGNDDPGDPSGLRRMAPFLRWSTNERNILLRITSHPAMFSVSAPMLADDDEFEARLRSLSAMQFLILLLICRGKLNKQIAYQCGIAEATVKSHVASALKRLGLRSRIEAAVKLAIFLERRSEDVSAPLGAGPASPESRRSNAEAS